MDRVVAGSGGGRPAAGHRRGARRVGVLDGASDLQAGDHVCWTYASDAEHRQVLTIYFSEGLRTPTFGKVWRLLRLDALTGAELN